MWKEIKLTTSYKKHGGTSNSNISKANYNNKENTKWKVKVKTHGKLLFPPPRPSKVET